MASSESNVVVFRGGFSAPWPTVQRLLDLEARGATFELLPDDRFRVVPSSLLTPTDVAFLRAHRDEARQVIAYTERLDEVVL
jgi:hypothetical protein